MTKDLIDELNRQYEYQPLPPVFSRRMRQFYRRVLPANLNQYGDSVSLVDNSGNPICNGYRRIVIGDYGAYVEFEEHNIHPDAGLRVQLGQEFRDNGRYNCKYSWLTNAAGHVKIYLQKERVKYADYIPGLYYVHVDDVEVVNEGKN
jgi:hypothetical protein